MAGRTLLREESTEEAAYMAWKGRGPGWSSITAGWGKCLGRPEDALDFDHRQGFRLARGFSGIRGQTGGNVGRPVDALEYDHRQGRRQSWGCCSWG